MVRWFFEEREGNCRLMAPFAVQLLETVTTWRRAVGPVAEWVAREFWKHDTETRCSTGNTVDSEERKR